MSASRPFAKNLQHVYPATEAFSYKVPAGKDAALEVLIGGVGEYLPRVYKDSKELSGLDVIGVYAAEHSLERISGGPCQLAEDQPLYYESLNIYFSIQCDKASRIALPISYNDYTVIKDVRTNQELEYSRIDKSDPRIIIDVPAESKLKLKVSLPTVLTVLKKSV